MRSLKRNFSRKQITGIAELYEKYREIKPDIELVGGTTSLWVIDDHNVVVRACYGMRDASEEWSKLEKEEDCWYQKRRRNNEDSSTMLAAVQMNYLDKILTDYLAEKEFLDD